MKEKAEKLKDLQMAKLWASQKRLADRRSQVDELRARRCLLILLQDSQTHGCAPLMVPRSDFFLLCLIHQMPTAADVNVHVASASGRRPAHTACALRVSRWMRGTRLVTMGVIWHVFMLQCVLSLQRIHQACYNVLLPCAPIALGDEQVGDDSMLKRASTP